MKTCSRCKGVKDAAEFARSTKSPDGLQYWCRNCNTEAHREWARNNPDKQRASRSKRDLALVKRQARYGRLRRLGVRITKEEFDAASLIDACQICKKYIEPETLGHHLDHDHRTGQFRGVLCHSCNTSLGHFGDDPVILRAAISYLEAALERYDPDAPPLPPTPGRTGRKKVEHASSPPQ